MRGAASGLTARCRQGGNRCARADHYDIPTATRQYSSCAYPSSPGGRPDCPPSRRHAAGGDRPSRDGCDGWWRWTAQVLPVAARQPPAVMRPRQACGPRMAVTTRSSTDMPCPNSTPERRSKRSASNTVISTSSGSADRLRQKNSYGAPADVSNSEFTDTSWTGQSDPESGSHSPVSACPPPARSIPASARGWPALRIFFFCS